MAADTNEGGGGGGAPGSSVSALSAIPVTTPRGELVITYVPARSAFGYYTDRKSSIPYTHLETAARMFLVKNARPDLARLAYVDRRKALAKAADKKAVDKAADKDNAGGDKDKKAESVADTTASGGLFAMFKSYNRKSDASRSSSSSSSSSYSSSSSSASSSSSSAEPAPAVDTHFVYLGTMHDYASTRAKNNSGSGSRSSGSSGEESSETTYINIKYSDFKKGRTGSVSSSPPSSQRSRL